MKCFFSRSDTERGTCVEPAVHHEIAYSRPTVEHEYTNGVQHSWASLMASMEHGLDTQQGSWPQPLAKHCHSDLERQEPQEATVAAAVLYEQCFVHRCC